VGTVLLSSEFRVSWRRDSFWFIGGGWTASRKINNPWVAFWDIIVTNCKLFVCFAFFVVTRPWFFGGFSRSN
jgi:hypothetical protein